MLSPDWMTAFFIPIDAVVAFIIKSASIRLDLTLILLQSMSSPGKSLLKRHENITVHPVYHDHPAAYAR
jgi:hypothetical protein